MHRRRFLACCMAAIFITLTGRGKVLAHHGSFQKIRMSEDEWRQRLTQEQYHVLREEGTERSHSSPLNDEKRSGEFVCAGCDFPLFNAHSKYESHTGWPSFFDVLEGHVETRRDFRLLFLRTEYHCAKCGGHQGHIFKDGPEPTGLRYCNNGLALRFVATEEML